MSLLRPAWSAARYAQRKLEALLTRGLRREVLGLRAEVVSLGADLSALRQESLAARSESMALLREQQDRLLAGQNRLLAGQNRLLAGQNRMLQRLLSEMAEAERRQGHLAPEPSAPPDPGQAWQAALHGIGVLNYENSIVSGEQNFLTQFFRHFAAPVVLDVGANEGQFADLARSLATNATIHCFEPQPRAFAVLASRAEELGITPHQLAVSDADGEAEFFDYADEQGSQHASLYREVIEGVHGRPATGVKVRCARLDALLPSLGVVHVGLLKIDTEGHELAVLRGARGLIEAGAVDVIQFEFNEMNIVSRVFMKDFFDLLPNYRLYRLMPRGAIELARYDPRSMEIFAFQNIACVRRDLDPHWVTADSWA